MRARLMLSWLWTEIISVALVGSAGMVLFELLWTAVRMPGPAPRSFVLFAGVLMCAWLHPRLARFRFA